MNADSWLRAEIELGAPEAEPVERALLGVGALSIDYRDAGGQPLLEPPPGTLPLWERLRIAALFRAQVPRETISGAVAEAIAPAPLPLIQYQVLYDRDWVGSWRESLRPARYGSRLWVCPTGAAAPDPQGIRVELDPGLAFGSGSHATTSLCLDWLSEQTLVGARLLDYGCGSGILAIAGLALGARSATGVDIDPQALEASRANARINHCLDRFRLLSAPAWPDGEFFDVIVANILSGTLIELEPVLRGCARAGTRVAMSGILVHQEHAITKAYRDWILLTAEAERDGWALLTGIVKRQI